MCYDLREVSTTAYFAGVQRWHRGGLLGPVHARSRVGWRLGCHSRYSKRFACRCVLRGCGVAVCGYYYLGRMRYGYISACAASLSRQDALRLLSRHARAAATISARAAVQLSQHGLRRGYYLGVGCAAATISAYLRGPQLLSRHKRSVSERVGYYLRLYLPWLSFGYYVSAVPAKPTWQRKMAFDGVNVVATHLCAVIDAIALRSEAQRGR